MGGGSTASLRRAVAFFAGAMPTGVAVARGGWIFVNFPKWGDDVQFTVADAAGNIYTIDFEHNAVLRRRPDGQWETVARNPQLLWTDTMLVADIKSERVMLWIVPERQTITDQNNGV